MSDRVAFTCNGREVTVPVTPGESLLAVLRERLGLVSVKDGCAPQGQCGCCTVLIDGDARVACVTPAARIEGRSVVTLEGIDAGRVGALAERFVATGGSQCGFCTPGILVRALGAIDKHKTSRVDLDRALAAHVCRCTGYQSIYEALDASSSSSPPSPSPAGERDLDAAARRAELEGGVPQRVGAGVPRGEAGFADDRAPRDALVAVPLPPGSAAESVEAAGIRWVVGESLLEARAVAAKIPGRRTTVDARAPLPLPPCPGGGVRLATSWVEPAYLEPDSSWCEPGGEPASSLANGGAFGGKLDSVAMGAARALADRFGRTTRTVFSREDVVRLGPKRPPIAGTAVIVGGELVLDITALADAPPELPPSPYTGLAQLGSPRLEAPAAGGLTTSWAVRAAGLAEETVLREGAIDVAGLDRSALGLGEPAGCVLLDTVAAHRSGACAGARVEIDEHTGAIAAVSVRVAAGDPLDEVVLTSYVVGAAHMALGWVLTEGLAVDAETGAVGDLTMRSFGIIPARHVPPIEVTIVDDDAPPRAAASDAAFAAVASAAWNALARSEGVRPEEFPASATRTARRLRR